MKLMNTINTVVLMLLLVVTSVSAEVAKPNRAFNPATMFDLFPKASTQKVDSAFHNYGKRGYDFVVDSLPNISPKAKKQLASLETN